MALNRTVAASNFYCMVNGQSGGYLQSFTAPDLQVDKIQAQLGPDGFTKFAGGRMKLGDAKAVTNISEANALWQLIEAVQNKNCQYFEAVFGVADQNYKSIREIEMMTCLIKEVSFKALDAKDAKSLMEVTVSWTPEDVKYQNGSQAVIKGNLSQKAKGWQTSYFDCNGVPGGIPAQCISKVDLCKHTAKIVEEHTGMHRRPQKNYASWAVEGLKTEGSATNGGYEAARDYCVKLMYDGVLQESEFVDWGINIKDPSHKNVVGEVQFIQTAPMKFTTGAEAKVGEAPLQWTIEWACEGQIMKINHKA